jgi:hypothetical protein
LKATSANTTILNYGTSSGDSNLTSYNQGGSVNVSLGFTFTYLGGQYTTVQINSNGFVYLNGTAFVSAWSNLFCTNGTGAVYSRVVTNASDFALISAQVVAVYTNYTAVFTASQAFVITWYNVALVTSLGQLNTFQLIFTTDGVSSFILFNYARLDSTSQMSCFYSTTNSSNLVIDYVPNNCTVGGTYVALVNTGSN